MIFIDPIPVTSVRRAYLSSAVNRGLEKLFRRCNMLRSFVMNILMQYCVLMFKLMGLILERM